MNLRNERTPVERWFLRRGIPHFIDGYAAGSHILTRAAPLLSAVFALEVVGLTFGDRFSGLVQGAVAVAAVAVMLGSVVLTNRVRGRRALQLPDEIGGLEVAVFVLVPALIVLIFGTRDRWDTPLIALLNIGFLILVFAVTSYGLVPMTVWGVGQMRLQLRESVTLMIKTLPLLLLFGSFFFLSTEVWQLADDFAPSMYTLAIGGLVVLGSLFVWFSNNTNVAELAVFDSWEAVCHECQGTPLEGVEAARLAGRRRRHRSVAALVLTSGSSCS